MFLAIVVALQCESMPVLAIHSTAVECSRFMGRSRWFLRAHVCVCVRTRAIFVFVVVVVVLSCFLLLFQQLFLKSSS